MKKVIIASVMVALLLSGCSSGVQDSSARFKKEICTDFSYYSAASIITDTETGVQYLFCKTANAGGLTVLVDKNGKPLLAKETYFKAGE